MAVLVSSGMATSLTTGVKSADQVSGTFQFVGKGRFTLVARGSATGLYCTLLVGGIAVINDQPLMYFGTSGVMSIVDHVVASQVMNGGRIELTFRNPTGGTLTFDHALYFEPM